MILLSERSRGLQNLQNPLTFDCSLIFQEGDPQPPPPGHGDTSTWQVETSVTEHPQDHVCS